MLSHATARAEQIRLVESGETVILNFQVPSENTFALEWKAVSRRLLIARGTLSDQPPDTEGVGRACFSAPTVSRPTLIHVGWKCVSDSHIETGVIRYLNLPAADTGSWARTASNLGVALYDPLRLCRREIFWGSMPRVDDPMAADSFHALILGPGALSRMSTDAQLALARRAKSGLRLVVLEQDAFDTAIWPVTLTGDSGFLEEPYMDTEIAGEFAEFPSREIEWFLSETAPESGLNLLPLDPSGSRALFVARRRLLALEYEMDNARLIFWHLPSGELHPAALPRIGRGILEFILRRRPEPE